MPGRKPARHDAGAQCVEESGVQLTDVWPCGHPYMLSYLVADQIKTYLFATILQSSDYCGMLCEVQHIE